MEGSLLLKILGIAFLIGLNAFFVTVEFAVVAIRRTRIEQLAEERNGAVAIVRHWVESQEAKDRLIAAAQVGVTIVSLALGDLGENTAAELLEPWLHEAAQQTAGFLSIVLAALPVILSLTIVTGLHVVLGEQVPKVASLRFPEQAAILAARPMYLFTLLFHPFVWVLDRLSSAILRALGMQPMGGHSAIYTVEELKLIVEESEESGVIEPEEREMLHAVFDLGNMVARQVMIPRTEMVCISADATLDEVVELAAETLLTKFPVYEGDLDHIIGILHTKDLVRVIHKGGANTSLRDLAREALFLPETIRVDDLLAEFRRARQHIAILLDEYGGTAGLVTLEDLVEEILGDIQDAFDRQEPEIQPLSDGSYQVDGLALIEEVNDALGLNLSDPHYDTIAGFVMGQLGRIPQLHDEVEVYDNGRHVWFRVEEMDGKRIARLRIQVRDHA